MIPITFASPAILPPDRDKSWGEPHVWLVDPHSRRTYNLEAGLHEVPSLPVPELGVEVTPSDLFE